LLIAADQIVFRLEAGVDFLKLLYQLVRVDTENSCQLLDWDSVHRFVFS
jgi:hypothetical protein